MENISVSVRVRPLNRQEQHDGAAWKIDKNSMFQIDPFTTEPERSRDSKYALDHIFGPEQSTDEVYGVTAQGLIRKLVHGFNSTVFAYGQTSSGKTHTMRGSADQPGIIAMAVQEVFGLIDTLQDREFLLRVSYMELYNEDINDLLAPGNIKLPIHESKENGVYVAGLREDIVVSPEQVLALLAEGEANRHIGATKMNEGSSRSHTVFRMVIESRARDCAAEDIEGNPDAGAILVSTLTLVDLAGSERVAKTGAEGIRMKEGTAINKSLLTLGTVINKLSEGVAAQGGHIPYRDSKLTRILQPSLGGNAKTAIICNITPAACHVEESHSTLRFACRAKRVVNNAVVNEVLSDAAVLKRQANEIAELRRALAASGNADVEEQIGHLRAQLLRSEQDNELMRIKLEQETAEREKAQKQVEVAKKIMFEQQRKDEGGQRKNSRRETWCPGRSTWAPPLPDSAGRKRPLQALSTLEEAPTPGSLLTSVMEEEDETVQPASQRARHSDAGDDFMAENDNSDEPVPQLPASVAMRKSSVAGSRATQELVEMLQARVRELEAEAETGQHELAVATERLQQQEEALRYTASQVEELSTAKADLATSMQQLIVDKNQLMPQLEQARWQGRQAEKKLEDMAAAKAEAEQVAAEAQQALADATDSAACRDQQLNSQLQTLSQENSKLKEQLKELNSTCLDLQGQLEVQAAKQAILEAREKQHEQQLQEQAGKMQERMAEVESLTKQLQAAGEELSAAEDRARELYDCNKRLDEHVHDLESRKRAPLYQKKQEDELKAAVDKAVEAETRAQEAELRMKEMRDALETANKAAKALQEQLTAAQQAAIDEAARVAEAHTLLMHTMHLERTKLEAAHQDAISGLHAEAQRAQQELTAMQQQLVAKDATIAEQLQQVACLQSSASELQGQLGESQACAAAAKERIELLEQEAEEAAAEHQQALETAAQALNTAQKQAAQQLQQAQEAATGLLQHAQEQHAADFSKVQAELAAVKAAAEAEVQQLQYSLDSTSDLLKKAMEAAAAVQAEAAAAESVAQKELEALKAKLAEAAGVLNAKEELRGARVKHKQEVAALKQDLQKLQQDSKSGQKSKDAITKDLDATKKKLQEVEAKLKMVIADKQTALQDKANLERMLKQLNSRSSLLEKNLEKKDAQAEKRRDSIMVGLNKTKDQLSQSEDRIKQLQLDVQRTQMDLLAKAGECSSLEQQLAEVLASEASLTKVKAALEAKLAELEVLLASTTSTKEELTGTVATLSEQLSSLEASSTDLDKALKELQEEHQKVCSDKQQMAAELAELHAAHKQLLELHEALNTELGTLQPAHAELKQMFDKTSSELQSSKVMLQKSQEARVHAEGRLPEIGVLQKQISKAHEDMSDLRFKLDEQRAAAAAKEQQQQSDKQQMEIQLEAATHLKDRLQLEATAATNRATQHEKQLEELYELCTTQQEKLQSLMDEKKVLEMRADNLSGGLQKAKTQLADVTASSQQLQCEADNLNLQLQQQEQAANDAASQLAAKEAELQQLKSTSTTEVQAWQSRMKELKEEHKAALAITQSQLDQAYSDLNELQFSTDQDKVQLQEQVQQAHERIKVLESQLSGSQAGSLNEAQQLLQQVADLSGQHVAAQAAAQQLQQALANCNQQLAVLSDERDALAAAVESLTLEVQQGQQQLAARQQECEEAQQWAKQLASMHDKAEEVAAAANKQLQQLQASQQTTADLQHYQCQQQRQELVAARDTAQQACATAVDQLQQLQASKHAAEEALHSTQQQLVQMQSQAEHLAAACKALEGDKASAAETVLALGAQLTVKQEALAESQAMVQQLETEHKVLLEQAKKPQQQLAASPAALTAAASVSARELAALQETAAKAVQLQAEVQQLKQCISELEQQLQFTSATGAGTAASGASFGCVLDPNTPARSRDHLKWEISSMGDELRASEQRRRGVEQQLVLRNKQVEEMQQQVAEMQEQLHEALKRAGPAASYAAVLRGDEARCGAEHGSAAAGLQADIMQQQLVALQEQAGADAAEVQRLSQALAELQQQPTTDAATIEALQQQKTAAEAAEEAVQQMQGQVQQLQQQVQQLMQEREVLNQQAKEQAAAAKAAQLSASEAQQELATAQAAVKQVQQALAQQQQQTKGVEEQAANLQDTIQQLQQEKQSLLQQLAASEDSTQANLQQLRCKAAEIERLKLVMQQFDEENTKLKQDLHTLQQTATTAEQLQGQLEHHMQQMQQLKQHNAQLQAQMSEAQQQSQSLQQEAGNSQKQLQQQLLGASQKHSRELEQQRAALEQLQSQLAASQTKATAEVEALLARDSHQAKQLEVLKAELARLRGGNTTGPLAATFHDEALQEVRQLAEAKQAELNAKVLQLESHIHWLQQDNQRLQGGCRQAQDAAAAAAAGGGAVVDIAGRLSQLESELRKSKRAEQKLQALLYRLRQDVSQLSSNPHIIENLQAVRSLEYEVDFLTNKCKKYEKILRQTAEQQQEKGARTAATKVDSTAQLASAAAGKENQQAQVRTT